MLAARLYRLGDPLALETVPRPTPGPGQILVKVLACGVCHTDLHACRGDWRATPRLPFIPGHEIVGEVVDDSRRRVGVFWLNSACGACEFCASAWESLCPDQINTGFTVPGGFAEYVCADERFAVPLPAEADPVLAAPLMCAGVSAFKAIRETKCRPGDTLAVVGCGGVGHLAVAFARAAGLRVVAIDARDIPLSLARDMGADDVVRADDAAAMRRLKKEGVQAAVVTAATPEAITAAVGLLRRQGIAILVGLPAGTAEIPVFDVVVKRLTIRGSIGGTRRDVAETVQAAARANIRPRVSVHGLSEVNEVFARIDAGEITGRSVLRISPES